ncbi:putative mitochondrial precursor of Hydroxyacyl-coenzyme A dehydrogenase [Podospora australis]|uniref:Mitochondrial of Hydroxyacyl-coenzyme A dehydrogenase n=1 Tax=Podospora australis TaxID=1536484 RepID=A0AAN6WXJ3_9PEZI|nr:putative mitochondrial precursor of Hydroxyacyl-coenzyme A dehydrogenase [Podospora australis]
MASNSLQLASLSTNAIIRTAMASPPLALIALRNLPSKSHFPKTFCTFTPSRILPRQPPSPTHPFRPRRFTSKNTLTPFFETSTPKGDLPSLTSTWRPPPETSLDDRPVLIIGAGTIGRRIALIWASNARPVVLYDISDDALRSATEYLTDNLGAYCAARGTHPGHVCTTSKLRVATTTGRYDSDSSPSSRSDAEDIEIHSGSKGPWLAIECLPENLDLKMDVLSTFEHYLPRDCVIASNSSSLMTSEMVSRNELHFSERLLNTHYFIPPRNRMVEVMSSTKTLPEIFPFLEKQMKRMGLTPMIVPRGVQSDGFIFNRIWAACKRETLAVLAEGVASPGDVDALFRDFFHAEKGPCERMDEVGLDTVARVQGHNLEKRPEAKGREGLEWLKKNYVTKKKLGEKTGDGLFTREEREGLRERHRLDRFKEVEETQGA